MTALILLVPPGLPMALADTGDKRAQPAYDGRDPAPPSALEVMIWIPRAVLYAPHLVAEYVLRRPLVGAIRWGDRLYIWRRVYDLFTWDQGRSGVYPTVSIDLGLKQTIGLTLFSREWPDRDNSLKVSTSISVGVLSVDAIDRYRVFRDGTGAVFLAGHLLRRPDGVFYGIGPDTVTSDKTFFGYVVRGGSLGLDGNLGGLNRAVVEVVYRDAEFGESNVSERVPSIDARYGGPGQPPLPPGFGGYRLIQSRVALVLDSRNPNMDGSPGTGFRVELAGAYAFDPSNTSLRFANWGGTGQLYLDLSGAGHVLGFALGTSFVEKLGGTAVPFTELATLGGRTLQGFLAGRLRADSAISATLQYRYPFWTLLDGELFAGVGNTFPGHLAGLRPDRLFASYGVGIRTTFARDSSFGVTLAFASTRLDAADFTLLDTTRFFVGVNHGF